MIHSGETNAFTRNVFPHKTTKTQSVAGKTMLDTRFHAIIAKLHIKVKQGRTCKLDLKVISPNTTPGSKQLEIA